jgi:magnesium transporter
MPPVLYAISPGQPRREVRLGDAVPADALWLDLLEPSEAERRMVEDICQMRVPRQDEIVEIETSSRLRQEGGALYLSMPVTVHAQGRAPTSLGYVLTERHLVTVRFAALPVFDRCAARLAGGEMVGGSAWVLVALLEAVVDHFADVLEHVGAELDVISGRIFHTDGERGGRRHEDVRLQASLRRIGMAGDLISNLRSSLLGIGRIVPYVCESAAWLPGALQPRMTALRQDIASLTDFDAQMMNKVQFLLDATMGFLNIAQNNGIKVLTVVSVVGIPPTLIASMYGMNFKNMPELSWAFGYQYGLVLIALSIVLPLVWFRVKGWL